MRPLLLVLLCALIAICGCTPKSIDLGSGGASSPKIPSGKDTITVFLTGNLLGTLQPCGCSAGQLGGFSRRQAVLATVADDRKIVADTGNFLRGDTQQDLLKLGIIFQALSILKYDVANLNPDEMALVSELGLIDGGGFEIITSASDVDSQVKASWSKLLHIAGRNLRVQLASVKAQTSTADSLRRLFGQAQEDIVLNILIVDDCRPEFADKIKLSDVVDVVLCPTLADEPRIVDKDSVRPLFVSVGRMGKYFGRLTAELNADNKLRLYYDRVAVDEKLPEDEALVQLYEVYKVMVRDEGLLEASSRVPLPDGLKYVGSENCHSCHGYEHDKWATKAHAHAYETLVKVGSQYDPECVGCHVVGFGYESGFITEASAKDLRNVGCEVCHGPGSDHAKAVTTGRVDTGMAQPQSKCIDCHTPDRSPDYQGNEKEKLEKIVHWREQKASRAVEK
ncbi:MAG: cytochrome c family protein [Dehalococcoidales bacterium]